MIEHGKCRGLDLGLNLKRGGPTISADFIVWRRPGQARHGRRYRIGLRRHEAAVGPRVAYIRSAQLRASVSTRTYGSASAAARWCATLNDRRGRRKPAPLTRNSAILADVSDRLLESVPCNICGSTESHVLRPAQYDIRIHARGRLHTHIQQLERRTAESSARRVRPLRAAVCEPAPAGRCRARGICRRLRRAVRLAGPRPRNHVRQDAST